jgi:NAD(P)-dependent dehydrogenase (short-subunit alcohol dehydrogenase family)
MNRFSLVGKNVLITGATGLLGQVFCQALAESGAQLALVDRDLNQVLELAKNLTNKYPKQLFKAYACDISNEEQVIGLVRSCETDFKNIHVLHNNAASKGQDINRFFDPFENFSLDVWREIMSVNVDGCFLMAKHVGAHMVKNKISGSIIQTASIYGVVAPDQRIYEGSQYLGRPINTPAVYSVSKAAVIGLTSYLSTYWGAQGIRVNTLTPGGIESGQNDIFKNKYSNRVPMGRMGNSDELVGALLFLASDASTYVNGQNLIVDGGLSVW